MFRKTEITKEKELLITIPNFSPKSFSMLPCEVNDYVSLLVNDLAEGERCDITPDFKSFL